MKIPGQPLARNGREKGELRMTMFCKFYICPGVSGDSPEEEKLLREHESEANDRGAEFYNYGWASGEHWIWSKTGHGFLGARIHPKNNAGTHCLGYFRANV